MLETTNYVSFNIRKQETKQKMKLEHGRKKIWNLKEQ